MTPRIPLAPRRNFRDLGGYETDGGAPVVTGRIFRSAHLHDLDPADRAAVRALGIRTVCDLRSREEATARPGVFDPDPEVEIHQLGVVGSRATGDPVQTIIEHGIQSIEVEDLTGFYRTFVDHHAPVYARVVALCADPARHNVVIHCSAGKDRTGIACALLLTVLGVPEERVIADYELTNELWSPYQIERAQPLLRARGIDFERLRTYFLAPAEVMTATLAHLRSTYGSVEEYLTGPGRLPESTLDALRSTLLATGAGATTSG